METLNDEIELAAENCTTEEVVATEETPAAAAPSEEMPSEEIPEAAAAAATEEQPPEDVQLPENDQNNEEKTLNPLNEPETNTESETKGKNRRYWTPKEEEKFYQIWGRENWRLTRHGKNTLFFAKWSDEMRDRFNFDIKPEEVQCKVNQTRAKFRQVKKHIESDKNYVKWKKYDIVEKILKNQYRSKDDDPIPLEALENNRDVSPTELINCSTQPCSPNSMSNMSTIPEQGINLSQSATGDHQLTDEINMSNVSLSDQNLTTNLFSNSSHGGHSFSTELFGSDQLEIKEEIEGDLKREGFINEFADNDQAMTGGGQIDGGGSESQPMEHQQSQLHQQLTQPLNLPYQQVPQTDNLNNLDQTLIQNQIPNPNPNSLLINNRLIQNHAIIATSNADGIINFTNHINNSSSNTNNNAAMQPPKTVVITPSPRKRNRQPSVNAVKNVAELAADSLETQYLEEVKKKNVLLVEQGEINRKRLRLEERKVKLMEDFFPKFMNLQEEILQKLQTVTNSVPEPINIKLED